MDLYIYMYYMFLESWWLWWAPTPIEDFSSQNKIETPSQNLSDDEMIKDWENTLPQNQREFLNRVGKSKRYNVEHSKISLHNHMRSGRLTTEDFDNFISYVRQPRGNRNISDDQAIRLWNNTEEFMSNGLSFHDALNNAIRWRLISDNLLNIETWDTKEITNAIFACIDKWNNIFDPTFKILVEDDIYWEDPTLSEGFSWDSLSQEKKDEIIPLVRERCKEKIQQSIEDYMSKWNNNTINSLLRRLFPSNWQPLSTDDQKLLNYFKIYIQADNYQQTSEKKINIQDKRTLKENFKAFCSVIWYKVDDVDEDLLKQWKEKREQEYKKNREKIEEYNRSRNANRIENDRPNNTIDSDDNKSIDLKNASWAEIAKNANLWKNVPKTFNPKLDWFLEWAKNKQLRNISFNIARTNFLKNNSFLFKKDGKDIGISSILTENKMHEIFDINSDTPSVNVSKLNEFMGKIENSYSVDEKEKIGTTLESFAEEFKNILYELTNDSNNIEDHIHETVNNHAIWAIIDNVKNIFLWMGENLKQWTNFQWFEFSENPAKINEDDLIISWTLDGAAVRIRYNLRDGLLYMSSFITETWKPPKITIWDSEPNDQIWSFITFDEILKNYYKSPVPTARDNNNSWYESDYQPISQWKKWNLMVRPQTYTEKNNSEEIRKETVSNFHKTLNQKIESIGVAVQDRMQSQSKINSVVTQFLKTFNILEDGQTEPINFEEWWNLFKALQIIKNSDTDTLGKFQEFMENLMKYGGLKRWENNESQRQDWKDDISPSKDDLYGNSFVDAMSNFESEKRNFEQWKNDTLWFADIIVKYLSGPTHEKLNIEDLVIFRKAINNCSWLEASLNKALNNID